MKKRKSKVNYTPYIIGVILIASVAVAIYFLYFMEVCVEPDEVEYCLVATVDTPNTVSENEDIDVSVQIKNICNVGIINMYAVVLRDSVGGGAFRNFGDTTGKQIEACGNDNIIEDSGTFVSDLGASHLDKGDYRIYVVVRESVLSVDYLADPEYYKEIKIV